MVRYWALVSLLVLAPASAQAVEPEAAPPPLMRDACIRCHYHPSIAGRGPHLLLRPADFEGSVHGDLCTSCHPPLRPGHPGAGELEEARRSCTRCHVEAEKLMEEGVHRGRAGVPTCATCHGYHAVKAVRAPEARRELTATCARCHGQRGQLYYNTTYHGKALSLGEARAAGCPDCHGSHAIFASSDPRSPVSPARRTATCARCHPRANPSFAEFRAHADPWRPQPPLYLFGVNALYLLLIGAVFLFGSAHTTLYALAGARRGMYARRARGGPGVPRFNLFHRVSHGVVMTTFTILVITGMPLRFRGSSWAQRVMSWVGGPGVSALAHRVAAAGLVLACLAEGGAGVFHLLRPGDLRGVPLVQRLRRRVFHPDSIFPSRKDLEDMEAMFRWFLGKGQRPIFNRFTYWEKFEYWAMAAGTLVIAITGLVMWFPELLTRVLPGVAINLSLVIHSNEAILAFGVIFIVFHFFNAHLRPEIYPLDKGIFTGEVPLEEAEVERAAWLERLLGEAGLRLPAGRRWAGPPGDRLEQAESVEEPGQANKEKQARPEDSEGYEGCEGEQG